LSGEHGVSAAEIKLGRKLLENVRLEHVTLSSRAQLMVPWTAIPPVVPKI